MCNTSVTIPPTCEEFRSRGIGREGNLTCFVCATSGSLLHNIAAFVQDKAAGERVVAMFAVVSSAACLDYRKFEPNWVQVKVGACDEHVANLQALDDQCSDGSITESRISAAAQS